MARNPARKAHRTIGRSLKAFDVIEAALQGAVARLDEAADAQRAEADRLRALAIAAEVEAGNLAGEASRAARVANRIAELTS